MAKTLITYGDKVTGGIPKTVHEQQWWFDDANETKNAINLNSTELYDRTDGNMPSQLVTAKVNWSNLSSTVQEQDLIWAAVNADPTTIVLHDHILKFRTIRKVYGQVGSIDTYDVIENIWSLRDKLTVTAGANVSLGLGNTLLDNTNGILVPSGRKVTKVIDGVVQEGGFTRDFGVTGATPIEDSVNAGAIAYPSKGLYLFKGNDGTDDYLYIYEGDASEIGTGSGVTTSASDFSILTEASADPADGSQQTIKLIGDNAVGLEAPLAIDFVGADVTQDPITDHAIVTINTTSLPIANTTLTFTRLKSHITSVVSTALTIDKTGAIDNAKTVVVFKSATNPDFESISGLDFVGGSWVADTDLLLEFTHLNDKVYLDITPMISVFGFVPSDLGVKLQMLINSKDDTTVTVDGSGNVSVITGGNGNDFSQVTTGQQPTRKADGLYFDKAESDVLKLAVGTSTIATDQQGEIFMLMSQTQYDQLLFGFGMYDETLTNEYIYFGQESGTQPTNPNTFFYRNKSIDIKIQETTAYEKYDNLGYNLYSVSCNGSAISIYKWGVAAPISVVTGTDTGIWFGDKTGQTTFSIFAALISSPIYSLGEISSILYSNEVLTTDERANVVEWYKRTFFGSINPINLNAPSLTPQTTYDGSAYHWAGNMAINPINNHISSVWDSGTSHYKITDLHSILFNSSSDGGVTFGLPLTLIAGASNISYTNPTIGYSSTGRLCLIYTKVDHTGGTYTNVGIFYRYSDDSGTTLSAEKQVAGVTLTDHLNSNSPIITSTDGNLYTTFYEATNGSTVNVQCLKSTDNFENLSIVSLIDTDIFDSPATDEPINETCIRVIADNTILAMTRVNSREYYNQYISTDNGTTWTKQGSTRLSDYWGDTGMTGTSSVSSHQIRFHTFMIGATNCAALIYMNREVGRLGNPSYLRVVFAKTQDLIDLGVEGWTGSSGVKMTISTHDLTNYDGYPDILFPDGNSKALIRSYNDKQDAVTDQEIGSETLIEYFGYTFPESYIKAVLNI